MFGMNSRRRLSTGGLPLQPCSLRTQSKFGATTGTTFLELTLSDRKPRQPVPKLVIRKAKRKSLSAQYAELKSLRKAVQQAMRDHEAHNRGKGYATRTFMNGL
jgi:hypothetical protein